MTEELLQRISNMLGSNDDEFIALARMLFWRSSPNYDDYLYLQNLRGYAHLARLMIPSKDWDRVKLMNMKDYGKESD